MAMRDMIQKGLPSLSSLGPKGSRGSYRFAVTLQVLFSTILLTHALPDAFASEIEVSVAKASTEQYERDVDEVALASQEKAISRLAQLLAKYRNTSQEPVLLAKLADFQQQNAAILFRIAHGAAHHGKKAVDLTRFNKTMSQSISTLDRLISAYPGYEDLAHAFYMRGKGYEEIGNKAAAGRDYLHLVTHYPDADESSSAYMALADFAIEANDHPRAIGFLNQVEKRPEDPHYPFALYKLAWSHYNLKNIPQALSYAERQIAYYNERSKPDPARGTEANSDTALRENTLMDLAVFYFEGYEENLPSYPLSSALPYFRKIESGPVLGRMILRFAKLLRSHSHEADLTAWKDQVLLSESARPESLDILITSYEFQLNQRKYAQLVESAQDMVRLYQKHPAFESFPRAQKLLLDTAEGLQSLIVKNKDASEVRSFSTTLAALYDSFTRIVDEKDPRIPRVHYNLAETLFTIKDYSGATEHYRWVVEHGSWDAPAPAPAKAQAKPKSVAQAGAPQPPTPTPSPGDASVPDASLKAIAARYEVLRQGNLIPKDLVAQPLAKDTDRSPDPLLAQWIRWIDTHVEKTRKPAKAGQAAMSGEIETFLFEANRALYAQNHLREAMERFQDSVRRSPSSRYAVPSASLVLDTLIASSDWERTHELASKLMEIPAWKGSEFSKRLFAVAADAFYKMIEELNRKHDSRAVVKKSDEFLEKYATSVRLADCLSLAGAAALEINEKKRANDYFTRLIREVPGSANVGGALLARAQLEEDRYEFQSAASDYRAFLALPPALARAQGSAPSLDEKQADALRRKALALTWLGADRSELRATLATKSVCAESLAAECEKYAVLDKLGFPEGARDEATTADAFERTRKSTGPARALWAALALEGAKNLAFRDRLLAIRALSEGWESLDPLARFTLLPSVSVSIQRAFELNRMAMNEVAPLRAEEKYITHRIDMIRETENAASKAMKLPWARVRAQVLNEIAGLYLDLSRGLSALPMPKGLSGAEATAYDETIRKITMPFEEKGQDMRGKAFEIASKAAIEEESFEAISKPFFAENPSQAKALKASGPARDPAAIDLKLLTRLDPDGRWDWNRSDIPSQSDNPALYLKVLWMSALKARRWAQVAFFMQEGQEKALIQAGVMGAVKAVSLAAVGARAEALAELEEARSDLGPDSKILVTMTLADYFARSFAKERSQALLKELPQTERPVTDSRAPAAANSSS